MHWTLKLLWAFFVLQAVLYAVYGVNILHMVWCFGLAAVCTWVWETK